MHLVKGSFGRLLGVALGALSALAGCADDGADAAADSGVTADAGDTDTGAGAQYPFDISGMEWANVPGGLDVPTADVFAGKVVLVLCFQAW